MEAMAARFGYTELGDEATGLMECNFQEPREKKRVLDVRGKIVRKGDLQGSERRDQGGGEAPHDETFGGGVSKWSKEPQTGKRWHRP